MTALDRLDPPDLLWRVAQIVISSLLLLALAVVVDSLALWAAAAILFGAALLVLAIGLVGTGEHQGDPEVFIAEFRP